MVIFACVALLVVMVVIAALLYVPEVKDLVESDDSVDEKVDKKDIKEEEIKAPKDYVEDSVVLGKKDKALHKKVK